MGLGLGWGRGVGLLHRVTQRRRGGSQRGGWEGVRSFLLYGDGVAKCLSMVLVLLGYG